MEKFKEQLLTAKFSSIIGQQDAIAQIKSALLVDRHIILVGPPGVGKTTIAKSVAALLPDITVKDDFFDKKEKKLKGIDRLVRVQGSPDLTAEDLIGDIDPVKAMKYGPLSIEAFQPGKLFKANNGILFFDEINRASEKLQNALLQALEEGSVTIGSYTVDIPVNVLFIGTMNPEDISTEELSEVFLDRFDLIYVEHPKTSKDEYNIVKQSGIDLIEFPKNLLENVIEFVRNFRHDDNVMKKPGVRASIGIYERAQAFAKLNNRNKVVSEDVGNSIKSVLAHRMELKPSKKYMQSTKEYIEEQMKEFFKGNGDGL